MLRYIYILTSMLLFLTACTGDGMYDNTPDEAIRLSRTAVVVGRDSSTELLSVVARDGSWSVTGEQDWFSVSPESGSEGTTSVTIEFEKYVVGEEVENETEPRTAILTFTSGGGTATLSLTQLPTEKEAGERNEEYGVNMVIHEDHLNPWYYNGETKTTKADYNQSYDEFWENYLENLKYNELDGNTWSTGRERYLYSYVEKNPVGTAAANAPKLGYGMEFDLGNYDGKLVGRILYVEDGSPAQSAGLKRGDWFYKVNDVQLANWEVADLKLKYKYQYNRLIDSLVHPVEGFAPKLGMLEFQMYAERLEDRGRTVSVIPAPFRGSPILHSSTIVAPDVVTGEETRTGYLVLNRFDPDYEVEIVAAFEKYDNLTHFILDLRYNKSGTVEMVEKVCNLLVPEAARGMTLARYEFNEGANNRTAVFEPAAASVQVDTVIVLTGPRTAGGSELVINALRGIDPTVKLVVVGDVSQGMSVGMIRQQYAAEEWEYDMYIAAFTNFNAMNEGEYGYGLVPNGGTVGEWSGLGVRWSDSWGWKGELGKTEDPLLMRAMELVTGVSRMPLNRVLDSSMRQRSGLPREFSVPTNMTMNNE